MKNIRFAAVVAAAFLIVFQASTIAAECTPKSFRRAAKQCASQFFDVITTDAESDCSLVYQTMVNCIKGEKENCWKRCSSEWTPQEISNQAWSYISNENFFCKKGMFKSFDPATAIKGCTGTFYRKAGDVSRRFHKAFQEERNSSKLCGLFSGSTERIKKYLQDYCTPTKEVRQITSQYGDTYNPYCRKGKTFLETRFGRCTRRSWEKLIRKCTAKFVDISKENGGEDCASAFRSYHSCKGAALTYCQEGFYSKQELSQYVNESLALTRETDKHLLCDGTNMVIPSTRPGQCKKEYREEVQRCGAKMYQTYRANRADPSLCREYAKAKICATKVIKSMCSMTKDMKAYVEFYYDDFNPFSSTHLDPELTPTTGETTESTTKNSTTSQAKTEHPPVHLVLGLVVLVWVF